MTASICYFLPAAIKRKTAKNIAKKKSSSTLRFSLSYPQNTNNEVLSLFNRHCMINELKKQIKYTPIIHLLLLCQYIAWTFHTYWYSLYVWTNAFSDRLTLIYRISWKFSEGVKHGSFNEKRREMQHFLQHNFLGKIFLVLFRCVTGAKARMKLSSYDRVYMCISHRSTFFLLKEHTFYVLRAHDLNLAQ